MTTPTTTTLPLTSSTDETRRLARWHAWESFKNFVKWPFYRLYEQRLEAHLDEYQLPQHLGMIMDGNRRFARGLGSKHISVGHQRGAEKLWQVLNWCYDAGIPMATVWSFSIDNFNRDTSEVESLLELFEEKTRELIDHADIHAKEVRVRYIGKLDMLPESLQEAIRAAEAATRSYDKYFLNIAMAYGGRQEITDALKRHLAKEAAAGKSLEEVADEIDEKAIDANLYTQGLPEPDLILRTSGEVRLSGFLLWQSAYSEFYFCDTHWPAFRRIDFLRALRSHHLRQRRYGR